MKNHIRDTDAFLKPYFVLHGLAFGNYIAQTIHSGISLFLAKAINGIKYMNGDYLDFKDLFMDIQMQKIRLSLQTLPTNIKTPNGLGGDSSEVKNQFKRANDCLTNDQYRKVFGYRNRSGLEVPKMNNGGGICWNFHAKGSCKSNCNRKESHCKLNSSELERWNKYTNELGRRNRNQFQPNNGHNNGQGNRNDGNRN